MRKCAFSSEHSLLAFSPELLLFSIRQRARDLWSMNGWACRSEWSKIEIYVKHSFCATPLSLKGFFVLGFQGKTFLQTRARSNYKDKFSLRWQHSGSKGFPDSCSHSGDTTAYYVFLPYLSPHPTPATHTRETVEDIRIPLVLASALVLDWHLLVSPEPMSGFFSKFTRIFHLDMLKS